MTINMRRVQTIIEKLATISSEKSALTRLAFSQEDIIAHNYIIELCKKYDLEHRSDEIGNLFIRKAGIEDHLPVVALGSHLDTVVNAGKFDGILGSIAGLEILFQLCEKEVKTRHPVELIIFTCEESSRFNYATLGSKVMSGLVDQASLSKLCDKQGNTLREVLANIGLDLSNVNQAKREGNEFKCFFELHIEQGTRLENENKTIGIVTGIAAPIRGIIKIKGQADHSGATAMQYRHDALLAGAEIALAIEQAAIDATHSTVATVGNLTVNPGVMNVVPGDCELLVDIRSIDIEAREFVLARLQQTIKQVTIQRGVEIEWQLISKDSPILLSGELIQRLCQMAEDLGYSYEIMPSGAGHDAMHMATLCPTGMLFVPSRGGISHNPLEFTEWRDIESGIKLLQKAVLAQAEII